MSEITRLEFDKLKGIVITVRDDVEYLKDDKMVRDAIAAHRLTKTQRTIVWVSVAVSILTLIAMILLAVLV